MTAFTNPTSHFWGDRTVQSAATENFSHVSLAYIETPSCRKVCKMEEPQLTAYMWGVNWFLCFALAQELDIRGRLELSWTIVKKYMWVQIKCQIVPT